MEDFVWSVVHFRVPYGQCPITVGGEEHLPTPQPGHTGQYLQRERERGERGREGGRWEGEGGGEQGEGEVHVHVHVVDTKLVL